MKELAFSKTIYDTLLQAYRPFIVKILLTVVLGFLGRFLFLSNAQILGQHIDQVSEIQIEGLKPIVTKLFILLLTAFTLHLYFALFFPGFLP